VKNTELELQSTNRLRLYGASLDGSQLGCQDYSDIFELDGVGLVNEKWLLKLVAERDELLAQRGQKLQVLQALQRCADTLREMDMNLLHNVIEEADAALAADGGTVEPATYFTHTTKGGSYERLGAIRGAGTMKGLTGVAYRDDKGGLFIREPECFARRMVLVGGEG